MELKLTNIKYYSIVLYIDHEFSICYRLDVRDTLAVSHLNLHQEGVEVMDVIVDTSIVIIISAYF